MRPRWILILELFALLVATPAQADTTVALGTVLRREAATPDAFGMRGLLAGSLAHIAVERFQPPGMSQTRTRAEIGLHMSFALGIGVSVEPSLGLVPFDMTKYPDDTTVFVVSAVAGVRFSVRVWGVFSVFIEPLRVEGRLLTLTLEPDSSSGPTMDRSFERDYASSAGVAVTW